MGLQRCHWLQLGVNCSFLKLARAKERIAEYMQLFLWLLCCNLILCWPRQTTQSLTDTHQPTMTLCHLSNCVFNVCGGQNSLAMGILRTCTDNHL